MGKTTNYTYDLVNNITTTIHPDNTGTTVSKFDSRGLLLSETDPLGRTKTYTYDANRNKRTETDALHQDHYVRLRRQRSPEVCDRSVEQDGHDRQ